MPWVKVDDHFDEHRKFAEVGPLGIALWLAGLAYCNRNLTDGFIPWSVARNLLSWEFLRPSTTGFEPDGRGEVIWSIGVSTGESPAGHGREVDSDYVIEMLVDAGLWDEAPRGFTVHSFHDYQPTRAEIESERAQKVAAGRAGGVAAARARARASAVADAVAKSKPVPVPVPVPVPGSHSEQTDIQRRDEERFASDRAGIHASFTNLSALVDELVGIAQLRDPFGGYTRQLTDLVDIHGESKVVETMRMVRDSLGRTTIRDLVFNTGKVLSKSIDTAAVKKDEQAAEVAGATRRGVERTQLNLHFQHLEPAEHPACPACREQIAG